MAEIRITKDNFESEVLDSKVPVLVDFWATWCGPCMMLAPTIEEIAEEYAATVKVGKVNVDEEPELASMFGIMSIPTVMVFKNGEVTATSVGVKPKDALVALLK
jgi:thioredoxin 1